MGDVQNSDVRDRRFSQTTGTFVRKAEPSRFIKTRTFRRHAFNRLEETFVVTKKGRFPTKQRRSKRSFAPYDANVKSSDYSGLREKNVRLQYSGFLCVFLQAGEGEISSKTRENVDKPRAFQYINRRSPSGKHVGL